MIFRNENFGPFLPQPLALWPVLAQEIQREDCKVGFVCCREQSNERFFCEELHRGGVAGVSWLLVEVEGGFGSPNELLRDPREGGFVDVV